MYDTIDDRALSQAHRMHLEPDDAVAITEPLRTVKVTATYTFDYEGIGDIEEVADTAKCEALARFRKGNITPEHIEVEEIE